MAVTTLWKFLQHAVRMRLAVTCKARWYDFMLMLVAINTGQIVVFGRICFQQTDSLFMTCPAVVRGGFLSVSDHKRHVDRMAAYACLKVHVLGVLFVAFHATRDFFVGFCVALVTGHISVDTRVFCKLITLFWMTRQTWSGNFAF